MYIIAAVRYGRVPKRSRELPAGISVNTGLSITGGGGGGGSAAAVLCNSFDETFMPTSPTTPLAPSIPVGAAEQNASVPSLEATNEMPPQTTQHQLTVYDVIRMIGDGHKMFCTYVDDLVQNLPRVPLEMPSSHVSSSSNQTPSASEEGNSLLGVGKTRTSNRCEADTSSSSLSSSPSLSLSTTTTPPPIDLDDQRVWLWQQSSIRITTAVQHVVEFAKRIPGFGQFDSDEQLILIKVGFFEVWLVQVTRTAKNGNGGCAEAAMTFDDGHYLTAVQLAKMYNVSLLQFLNSNINIVNKIFFRRTDFHQPS